MTKFYGFTGGMRMLDQASWKEEARRAEARARSAYIADILASDLDNDGRVTSGELERRFKPQAINPDKLNATMYFSPSDVAAEHDLTRMVTDALGSDHNGDGAIDFQEMRAAAEKWRGHRKLKPDDIRPIMLLDLNADESVSEDELLTAIDKAFDLVDQNKDHAVDASEVCAARILYVEPPTGGGIRTCF
jgi:Ca2+-binding EF-hand superfamily protein